jgi:hypothetical protein
MIWPIGQPSGEMHVLAMQSRATWLEILKEAALPHSPAGSLHVVYRDEAARANPYVMQVMPPWSMVSIMSHVMDDI